MPAAMDLAPLDSFDFRRGKGSVLLIACGALAREIIDMIEVNRWQHFDVACLPAIWHNTPKRIPEGVREKIRAARNRYTKIYVAYADCGTGGLLDKMLEEEGVERIDGPHCYSFFAGNERFAATAEGDDLTAFYLTDYLARHFDKLIWEGFNLDRPGMRDMMFGAYTKVVYLAQVPDTDLEARAEAAARKLGLAYEHRLVGYGDLEGFMRGASP